MDTLNASLNWSTFQLEDIRFGDETIQIPPGLQTYAGAESIPDDPYPVELTFELDTETGLASCLVAPFDTVTGELPEDPFLGFLAVNDESGRGEGYVSFRVQPKAGLSRGTVITNEATITFAPTYGVNPPILTDPVTNTIDSMRPPAASIRCQLPATIRSCSAGPATTVADPASRPVTSMCPRTALRQSSGDRASPRQRPASPERPSTRTASTRWPRITSDTSRRRPGR